MCTVLFAYKTWPGYRLVMAANRDEFTARPTAALEYWDDDIILAGRDLEAGGTWLGLSTSGKFGVITNFREPRKGGKYLSRGGIVKDFLHNDQDGPGTCRHLMAEADSYPGYNAVLGDSAGLCYCTNRGSTIRELSPGIYGLSNHILDTPWPKVVRGKRHLSHLVQDDPVDVDKLFAILGDEYRPSADQLPDTGVSIDWEMLLSSIFITSPGYGTRSSAVITISDEGMYRFIERSYSHNSQGWTQTGEKSYQFSIENMIG